MRIVILLSCVLLASGTFAQRNLNPRSKKDAFGKRDFRPLNDYGLQIQLGGTYLMTKLNNDFTDVATTTDGFRGNYTRDPFGKIGFYGEVGMFHFPKKFPKLKISKEKTIVLISYYDWGLGFKYFRGGESIDAHFIDAGGTETGSEQRNYNFSNGNVFARFSVHKNQKFKKPHSDEKTEFFLDHSLGINVDYRLMTSSDDYTWYGPMTANQAYTKPLQVQLHYGLGFGFPLKRGAWLIPGVRTPFLGYQQTVPVAGSTEKGDNNFGKPSIHWYSSRHWPLLFHVKYMFAFEKKPKKGCPPVEINSQDQDTQRNR